MNIAEYQSQIEYLQHSKQVHAYSPAVVKILDLYMNYIQDSEDACRQGKLAVWSSNYNWDWWQAPLLYACDTIPVQISEMSRNCSRDIMEIAENYFQFPVETCSMVKSSVGEFYRRKDTTPIRRIFANASKCEPYNQAYEVLKHLSYDLYTNDTIYRGPAVRGKRLEELGKFFVEQLYDAAEWLTGKRYIDTEKLGNELRRRNRIMDKLRKILMLREKHPFYVRSLAAVLLFNVGSCGYFGKPEEFETAIDLLIDELEQTPIDAEELRKAIPLVWAGATGQEYGLYEVIDHSGGALLGFRSAPYKQCREDLPPIESLVNAIFENQNAGAGCYTLPLLEQELKRLNARGLLLYGYLGCSYSGIEREGWRKYFQSKGVSCIVLEGSYEIGAPSGQVLTRIKAFIELLA